MALLENQNNTKQKIQNLFTEKMEDLFSLPDDISDEERENIKHNWKKLGEAIAEILIPICDHFKENAEIGTITSDVIDNTATQNNPGKNLIN